MLVQAIVICSPPLPKMSETVSPMDASVVTFQPAPVAHDRIVAQASFGVALPCRSSEPLAPWSLQARMEKPLGAAMLIDPKRPQAPESVGPVAAGGVEGVPGSTTTTSSFAAPPLASSSIFDARSPQQQQLAAATTMPTAGMASFTRHLGGPDGGVAVRREPGVPATPALGRALTFGMLLPLLACAAPDPADSGAADAADTAAEVVPWSAERAPLAETSPAGRPWRRGIVHLHSPFSHDACDNQAMDRDTCLADFRRGLCANAMDFAFVTDHPASAAEQPYEDLFWTQPGDEVVDGIANRIACDGGWGVLTLPGIEDELMPVGLDRHVSQDAAENDRLYNGTDEETVLAEIAAGGTVLQAHTEGQTMDDLLARQGYGQRGVEMFNLHAMVDPNKREEDLGLDAYGYIAALGPFLGGETDAEPDLSFLAFYEEQTVSLERWDALNRVAFSVGVAGTDAHENAIPSVMEDGERGDSYRRMIRWFSNVVLVDGDAPADLQAALDAGRSFVAFEVLGTPTGFDVSYGDLEMGGEAGVGGTLVVSCPTLAPESPRDGAAPEIDVAVFKDGAVWQEGCGEFAVTEPGVYRVRVEIVPTHLSGFLDDQVALIRRFPWLYSNAFRLGL